MNVAAPAAHRARRSPLAPFTTFKVGGPADWLAARAARRRGEGRAGGRARRRPAGDGARRRIERARVGRRRPRARHPHARRGRAGRCRTRIVRADGGLTINGLVRWTINRGVAGLEAWAGTPGTVGGAIYGNAHFQGRLIAELVESVELVDRGTGTRVRVARRPTWSSATTAAACSARARSCCRRISASDGVSPAALRAVARESLAYRKRTQPLESASAGCIFQNPDPAVDRVPDGIPASAGALVDRAGLKGIREGAARACRRRTATSSSTKATASADDIRALIERCRERGARAVRRRAARRNRLPGILMMASLKIEADGRCRAAWRSKATRTRRCR